MEFRDIYDTDDLKITRGDGQAPRLVLAFTGIGHKMGAIQQQEFVGASTGAGQADGRENTVLFITDKKRSWFSARKYWLLGRSIVERIREVVLAVWEEIGRPEIVTLGNSMGGFGAILFARELPVSTAIAFAPQFSMDDRVLVEPRWRGYRRNFGRLPVRGLDEVIEGPKPADTRFYILHGDGEDDRPHWSRFPVTQNVRHFLLPGAEHDAALTLKKAGVLYDYIEAALEDDAARAEAVLTSIGARRRGAEAGLAAK